MNKPTKAFVVISVVLLLFICVIGFDTINNKEVQHEDDSIITMATLYRTLLNNLSWNEYACHYIFIMDNEYYAIDNNVDIVEFLRKDNVSEIPYEIDFFDCDDYAITLMGNIKQAKHGIAFGFIIVRKGDNTHAMNFFVDNQNRIWLVEPQNDSIILYKDVKEYYKAKLVII